MTTSQLTGHSIATRPVLLPMKRPVVARVGRFDQWPMILIDVHTHEGITGRSYLAPLDKFAAGRKSLTLLGLEGLTLIALSGLDMAAWDARAQAAGVPLAVLLGGSVGPVNAHNSNGLWLGPVAGVGNAVELMVDFNQGLTMDQALIRCHAIDDQGLTWIEEPVAYDNIGGCAQLAQELKTPVMLGENFYGPRAMWQALASGACDLAMPDVMRIGGVSGWLAAATLGSAVDMPMSNHLYPEFSALLLPRRQRHTGLKPSTGRIRGSPNHTPSSTAMCRSRTYPVLVWHRTKAR